MKNLVLGALLAAASIATGCSSSDGDDGGPVVVGTTVTVNWDFTHLADGTARSCPSGFGTAIIKSQATDDTTHLGTGTDFVDKFDCSAGKGTIVLPDNDTYLVWVEITKDSESSLYAETNSTFVDTSADVPDINVEILDDGGYFFFTWDLEEDDGTPVACADANIDPAGAVDAVSTSIANANDFKDDRFTCADHYGTTDGLVAGTYTVAISVDDAGGKIGEAETKTNQVIKAPNKLTDLGHVIITLDP